MGMVTAVANGSVTVTATSDGVSGLAAVVVSQEFIVNSADDVDDGTCDASHCSLREVLRVANAFNSGGGVIVRSGTGNAILSNFIFSNGALGIGLIDRVEVTPNDLGDDDTGANDVQNFPVLTSAVTGGSSITIEGGLNSTGSTGFRLEFFANAACDPSGDGVPLTVEGGGSGESPC